MLQSVHCHIPSAVLVMYSEIKPSKSEHSLEIIKVISMFGVQTLQISCVFSCGSSWHFCSDNISHKSDKKTLVWIDGLTQHDSWHYFSSWTYNRIQGNTNYHPYASQSSD
eukprot:GFUD01078965.1.p1 GENE.GFUD01078965.1~~GFUD01078965.1.p1  ORF type:complete len:110 (+),score=3.67 GFUD01078965.1:134-463(+)